MDECLNARGYMCRSANYVYSGKICHLFSEDRYSNPTGFQAAPNVDYIENQCSTRTYINAYFRNATNIKFLESFEPKSP